MLHGLSFQLSLCREWTEKGISKCECHNCVHLLASGETHRRRGTARREKSGAFDPHHVIWLYVFAKYVSVLQISDTIFKQYDWQIFHSASHIFK